MSVDIDDNTSLVCYGCLAEAWLKNRIRSRGATNTCHYCGSRGKCVTVGTLSGWIRDVLDQHFQLHNAWAYYGDADHFSQYEQQGSSLEQLVSEMIEADVPVIDAVLDELTLLEPRENAEKERPHYHREASYVKTNAGIAKFKGSWSHFRQELEHQARPFNAYAKRFLDRLIQDIQSSRPLGRSSHTVIRTVKPDTVTQLYRARCAEHPQELEWILSQFRDQLGPPPRDMARPGRLNAAGVPIFQGAFDRNTCIAELRPSLGSIVVSGAFKLKKPVRLLDFPLLEQCYEDKPLSYFQPDYTEKAACRHFLRRLHTQLRQPSQVGADEDCLSTQIFAEYLSTVVKPRIDGIIYSSIQRIGGVNLVLFGHALDIQDDSSAMGADSVLHICDNSAQIHSISDIRYETEEYPALNGKVVLPLDADDFPNDSAA